MPLGLIATSPVSGSRALILPPVHVTRPFLGSSRCSFHSCSLSCSSISTLLIVTLLTLHDLRGGTPSGSFGGAGCRLGVPPKSILFRSSRRLRRRLERKKD